MDHRFGASEACLFLSMEAHESKQKKLFALEIGKFLILLGSEIRPFAVLERLVILI